MLAALCKDKYYLDQIKSRFAQIKDALQKDESDRYFDLYYWALIRYMFESWVKDFDPESQVSIFYKFLTNGFRELESRER